MERMSVFLVVCMVAADVRTGYAPSIEVSIVVFPFKIPQAGRLSNSISAFHALVAALAS